MPLTTRARTVFRFLPLLLIVAAPGWAQDIGRLVSPGPLSAAHAKLEGLDSCEKCHEPGKGVSATKCLTCHQPIADRIARKAGVHRDVTDECAVCHAEHAGRDADIRPLDKGDFDHLEETGFALDGRHAAFARDCARCHKTRSFLTLDPACGACHKDSHNGALGAACAACHLTSVPFAEAAAGFDHSRAAFKLEGAHLTVACAKCHPTRQYRGLRFAECSACHQEPHAGKLGPACSSCHTPTGWKTRSMDHTRTGFALVGAHATLPCAKCHVQPATKVKLKHDQCRDCHQDAHLGVFADDCAACHSTTAFAGGTFDHAARTGFALADRHAEIACVACHKQPAPAPGAPRTVDFRGASKDCATCHKDPHAGALGAACASCHGTRSFGLATFQHPRFPEFFGGSHAAVECSKCHKGAAGADPAQSPVSSRTYRGLSMECASCHRDAHLGQLGAQCGSCHSVAAASFKQVSFDHSRAEFPLTGKHATIECITCHKTVTADFPAGHGTAVQFKGTSGACITCHKDVHLGQLGDHCSECHRTDTFKLTSHDHRGDPEFFTGGHATVECRACHRAVETDFPAGHGEAIQFTNLDRQCSTCHEDVHKATLGDDCASCHTVHAPFRDPSRAFHKSTMLPLEGRHLQVPCADCHWDGQIKGTPTRCYDCHWVRRQDDRYRTRLGNECEQCHRPTSWTAVNWDHGVATGHQLRGAHATLECEACHVDGRFEPGLGTDCESCHLDDYQATDDPNHVAAGFPTTCDSCHSPSDTSWDQARFDHGAYPLVGAHASQPCDACHSGGVYQGLPSNCVDCHLDDYQGAEEPDHAAAGFPTTCDDCHNAGDASWEQGHFDHGTYPLVGAHASQPCDACHSGGVYQGLPSECVDCHLDDYQATTDPNHVAAGFPTDCAQCHDAADPEWGDGEFDHGTYPLVGAHAAQPCDACHSGGVYQGLPSDCVDCHLDDYQATTDPNHVAAGFPTDCEICHSGADASWDQGQFNHIWFPIASGHHSGFECSECHPNAANFAIFTCTTSCHPRGDTDHEHEGVAGYVYDSPACLSCHPDGEERFGGPSRSRVPVRRAGDRR